MSLLTAYMSCSPHTFVSCRPHLVAPFVATAVNPCLLASPFAFHFFVLRQIDLVQLCKENGWTFEQGRVVGLSAREKWVAVRREGSNSDERLSFTLLSLDVGSTVRASVDASPAGEACIATRPIALLNKRLEAFMDRQQPQPGAWPRVLILGGGAAGVELAFGIKARLMSRFEEIHPHVTLIDDHSSVLPRGYPRSTVRRIQLEAKMQNVTLCCGHKVEKVDPQQVQLANGRKLPFDLLVLATGPAAHGFLRSGTDLLLDQDGFARVRSTLQTTEHDDIFACGDCASMDDHGGQFPPKAGVYAVRHGPVVISNLEIRLQQVLGLDNQTPGELQSYNPQREFLSLLGLGNGRAVGSRLGFTFAGRWVWRMKDHIDRRWMLLFPRPGDVGKDEAPLPELPSVDSVSPEEAVRLLSQDEEACGYETQLAVVHRLRSDQTFHDAMLALREEQQEKEEKEVTEKEKEKEDGQQ